jgi:hypothetical protein
MSPHKELEKEGLKMLIEALQTALKYGFSSGSSPLRPLLESMIDLSLLISKCFIEGSEEDESINPGLKFSETEQDPLGNAKQIRVSFDTPMRWDPEAGKFFKALASFIVRLNRGDAFRGAFMALHEYFPQEKNTSGFTPEDSNKTVLKRSNSAKKYKQKMYKRRHQTR